MPNPKIFQTDLNNQNIYKAVHKKRKSSYAKSYTKTNSELNVNTGQFSEPFDFLETNQALESIFDNKLHENKSTNHTSDAIKDKVLEYDL